MPLAIEQESEDLLRQALSNLRSRMASTGGLGTPQEELLSRDFGDALARLDARAADVRPWETLPGLREEILGPLGSQYGLFKEAPAQPSQPQLPAHVLAPSRYMDPNRFDWQNDLPGFFYAGDPSGEQQARADYKSSPLGGMRYVDEWLKANPPQPGGFDPFSEEAIPVRGAPGLVYVPTPRGIELRSLSNPASSSKSSDHSGVATDPPIVTTKSQFEALPSGSPYRGKDGKLYRKP